LVPETQKVRYLATPLALGTVDGFHREDDLRASPINVLDREYDGIRTHGPWDPWEYVTDDEPAS